MVVDFLGLAHLFGMPTFNATWWYMSLAIVIIALIPLLCRGVKKLGAFYAAVLSAIVPFALGLPTVSLTRYFLCMVLGVIAAQKDGLAKSKEYYVNLPRGKKWLIFAAMTGLLALSVVLRQGRYKGDLVELWDSLIPVLLVVYLYWFVNDLRVAGSVLNFFGKYSTTIFLTHTFIRYYWLRSVSYYFTNAWLNFVTLTVLGVHFAEKPDFHLRHNADSLVVILYGGLVVYLVGISENELYFISRSVTVYFEAEACFAYVLTRGNENESRNVSSLYLSTLGNSSAGKHERSLTRRRKTGNCDFFKIGDTKSLLEIAVGEYDFFSVKA
jgi:peptidoglycan/LPS O-acetylase OafA/YrhL